MKYTFSNNHYILDRPLYKYYSNYEYAKDCLINKRIHLDDPYSFNDPFDDAVFNRGVGMDGKENSINKGLLKWGKVSCFSEVNDSILMWSYYADKHRGICIEFDFNRLNSDNELNVQIKNSIARVQYSPIRLKGDYFCPGDNSYMFTKADVWAHEHEWRIVCDSEEKYLPLDCISGIILGCNLDPQSSEAKDIIDIAVQEKIDIRRCILGKEFYRLEIE